MINYLVINVMLSLSGLTINYLMNIPHRIRFYIMMVAVIGWLTPFALMTIELTQQSVSMLPVQWVQLTEPMISNNTIIQSQFDFIPVLLTLMAIGLVRFVMDIILTGRHVNKLKHNSIPFQNHENIFMAQGINGAFVSGYFKPIIWIDEQLQQTEALPSVITHEQQHIKNHDQFWLLIITLVQRLFWFNPLSLILSQKTRKGIELSCDEACKNKLGKSTYQSHLAQLIMAKHQTSHAILNNQIHHDENFNIHRIKQLDKENTMNTLQKTKLTALITLTCMMCLYSLVTFAENESMPELQMGQVFIELKITVGEQDTKELSLITNDKEMAEVKFDGYHLSVKPSIIKPPENSATDEESIQIINELTLHRINDDQTQSILTTPTLLVLNKNWAGIKVGDDEGNKQIHIEIRPSVKD